MCQRDEGVLAQPQLPTAAMARERRARGRSRLSHPCAPGVPREDSSPVTASRTGCQAKDGPLSPESPAERVREGSGTALSPCRGRARARLALAPVQLRERLSPCRAVPRLLELILSCCRDDKRLEKINQPG